MQGCVIYFACERCGARLDSRSPRGPGYLVGDGGARRLKCGCVAAGHYCTVLVGLSPLGAMNMVLRCAISAARRSQL